MNSRHLYAIELGRPIPSELMGILPLRGKNVNVVTEPPKVGIIKPLKVSNDVAQEISQKETETSPVNLSNNTTQEKSGILSVKVFDDVD